MKLSFRKKDVLQTFCSKHGFRHFKAIGKVMKTTTTKLITKVDFFIPDIDFENKDNINQFSEL